eukprot:g31108.t1
MFVASGSGSKDILLAFGSSGSRKAPPAIRDSGASSSGLFQDGGAGKATSAAKVGLLAWHIRCGQVREPWFSREVKQLVKRKKEAY